MATQVPSVKEIRKIIESVENEKLRYTLMYQYIVGAEISELVGNYAPNKNNYSEVEIEIRGEKYPAILFFIDNIKPKERGVFRSCVIPLNPDFEPWSNQLLDFFKMHGVKYPFKYGDTDHNRNHSRLFSKVFVNLKWPKDPYGKSKIRYNDFRSADLRKLRMKNLREFYNFTPIDLARFGAWNEDPKDPSIRSEIRNILTTQYKEKNVEIFKNASKTYFEKLLRPIELMNKESIYPLQIINYPDSSKRYEIAREIVMEVKNINFLCRRKIHEEFEFFKENMWVPIEMFNPCGHKENAQFLQKIASLAALFEPNIEQLEYLKKAPDQKSILLMKFLLNEKKIKYNDDMFNTWFNIRNLRSKWYPIHSETELVILDILEYFGEPSVWPPDFNSLWDNILNKFMTSLIEFHDILNKM